MNLTAFLTRRGKFGHRHTWKRPCDYTDRGGTAVGQGTAKTEGHHQKLGRLKEGFCSESQRDWGHLNFGLLPSRSMRV